MVDKIYGSMGDLKVGKYVIIEDVPCKVVSIDKSKPGKHGAAKMNVVAIGLFDNTKRSIMKPSDGDVEIPIIERKRAQIVAVTGNSAQLMDLSSYETFEVEVPDDIKSSMESGREIEYMETMGRKLLLRMRGEE
ncbi:translation initiation factor IF-5A [Candidatus Micrarchaeota archaeon]|nr:translation initiation factor IF-5A [Candidatus Micrarchaeota archaeon]